MPVIWRDFGLSDIFRLVSNLDRKKQGYIKCKVFTTLICLFEVENPSEDDLEKYTEDLGYDFLERANFSSVLHFLL